MSDNDQTMVFATSSLRLGTLAGLRWLAIVGQTIAVLTVRFGFQYPLPLAACGALIGLSALVNIATRSRFPPTLRLAPWPAFAFLAFDIVQLAALLYLTGGLENPFSLLLLVPLIVSATSLPPRPTVILGMMIAAAASLLAVSHFPLPWAPGEPFEVPFVYTAGVWTALVCASIFNGIYAFRVAQEGRQLARALNAAEKVLAREQHLHSLDGLAAAAAHELGTPLATIALVVKELERDLPEGSPQADDIALLGTQSQRCREILSRLTSLSEHSDDHLARLPLTHLIEEVAEPYRAFAIDIVVAEPEEGQAPEPVGRRSPAIIQGLANLVENAVDFARRQVTIVPGWTKDTVSIQIYDDGPGFAAGILERIGEPYLTTRPESGDGQADTGGGLGLGFFIAKTLLERSGGRLELSNRPAPATGALVRVSWPREFMDAPALAHEADASSPASRRTWREAGETL